MSKTVQLSDEIAVDLDGQGEVVGVEFLLAPAELATDASTALFDGFPAVRSVLSELQAFAVG